MGTGNKWIISSFMLVFVSIFLERCLVGSCETNNNSKCQNVTLSSSRTVCYSVIQGKRIATVNCSGSSTNHTCQKGTWSWTPTINCTDLSPQSGTDATTTTKIILNNPTTKTNNGTATTSAIATNGLTTSTRNHTGPVLRQKQSDGYVALYVGVPCVLVVLIVMVILLIVWRRKHDNTNTKQNGFMFHNASYRRHELANTNNATIVPMTELSSGVEDNQYSEIPADTVNPSSEHEDTYNTIDLPDGVRDNYCHVTDTVTANDNTYSHMPDSSATSTDNTYSHIGNATTGSTLPHQGSKPTDGSANTYNTLQTLPTNRVQTKLRKPDVESDAGDIEYNHLSDDLTRSAKALEDEDDHSDAYSHICQSARANRTEDRRNTSPFLNQQTGTFMKNAEDCDKDKPKVNVASDVSPPYLEFKVEDQSDGDASTLQFRVLEHGTNERENEETDANHHYFILEKEEL